MFLNVPVKDVRARDSPKTSNHNINIKKTDRVYKNGMKTTHHHRLPKSRLTFAMSAGPTKNV